ncbi:MAG: hypothetical protein WC454_07570 [Phycisphaerae bacterium]|jgi:hypothetical protein
MKELFRRLAGVILWVLLVCLVLYGIFLLFTEFSLESPQTFTIDVGDVTGKSSITLASPSKDVLGLTIHVTGDINGLAYVFASDWEKRELSGKVDCRIYHDWSAPTCVLQYEPVSVTSGKLRIDYTFLSAYPIKDD